MAKKAVKKVRNTYDRRMTEQEKADKKAAKDQAKADRAAVREQAKAAKSASKAEKMAARDKAKADRKSSKASGKTAKKSAKAERKGTKSRSQQNAMEGDSPSPIGKEFARDPGANPAKPGSAAETAAGNPPKPGDEEKIPYVTDDIEADGNPIGYPRRVEGDPLFDGYTGQKLEADQGHGHTELTDPDEMETLYAKDETGAQVMRDKLRGRKVEVYNPVEDPAADVTRTFKGNKKHGKGLSREYIKAEENARTKAQDQANRDFQAEKDDGSKAEMQQANLKDVEERNRKMRIERLGLDASQLAAVQKELSRGERKSA
jgi:hypothetical protein